jgi:hypothetical protein
MAGAIEIRSEVIKTFHRFSPVWMGNNTLHLKQLQNANNNEPTQPVKR